MFLGFVKIIGMTLAMIRPPGKAYEIAKKVLKEKGIKVPKREVIEKPKVKAPYLQH